MGSEVIDVRTGWLSCSETGREELVALSSEHVTAVKGGTLPCPCCAACHPTFKEQPVRHDTQVMSWRDGRWQRGFVLGM